MTTRPPLDDTADIVIVERSPFTIIAIGLQRIRDEMGITGDDIPSNKQEEFVRRAEALIESANPDRPVILFDSRGPVGGDVSSMRSFAETRQEIGEIRRSEREIARIERQTGQQAIRTRDNPYYDSEYLDAWEEEVRGNGYEVGAGNPIIIGIEPFRYRVNLPSEGSLIYSGDYDGLSIGPINAGSNDMPSEVAIIGNVTSAEIVARNAVVVTGNTRDSKIYVAGSDTDNEIIIYQDATNNRLSAPSVFVVHGNATGNTIRVAPQADYPVPRFEVKDHPEDVPQNSVMYSRSVSDPDLLAAMDEQPEIEVPRVPKISGERALG